MKVISVSFLGWWRERPMRTFGERPRVIQIVAAGGVHEQRS